MKKNFFYATALALGLAFTATACSDDDDNSTVNPADIEYNSENAAGWHNYMRNVAALLGIRSEEHTSELQSLV